RLLRLAASLERASEHPLAAAIVSGAEGRGVQLSRSEEFQSLTGRGVKARVENAAVLVGNRKVMDEQGIDVSALNDAAEAARADGQTVMFVAIDGKLAGILGVADPIKETSPEAIRRLHDDGIRIVMLTGDSRTTAS